MGKVSPVSAKYIIHTNIGIEGTVDRPDVIGAIFGQTEGFLGADLELRELQRSGKIGRIEVKIDVTNGKCNGQIIIPSSLDKAETAIVAAALETIDRIGPCNSHVKVEKIEDVRISKRSFVIERAKVLLQELQANVLPDSQEITDEVSQSVRMLEITEWGREHLPAGPSVNESEEVLLVEGRADVLNLLKQGIKNTVALNGTSIPESIKDLCKQKTVTVFVDGDRGGDLIVRELLNMTEIDFVAKAPAGKEVEELTKKEILLSIRGKITAEQFKFEVSGSRRALEAAPQLGPRRPREPFRQMQRESPRIMTNTAVTNAKVESQLMPKTQVLPNFREKLEDLIGTRGAYILDKDCNILGKVPTAELEGTLKGLNNIHAVIFDGEITRELARAAENSNANVLVGMNSRLKPGDTRMTVLTHKDLIAAA